jgi:hypothetical protein
MPLRKNGSSMPFASSSNARRPSARARFVSTTIFAMVSLAEWVSLPFIALPTYLPRFCVASHGYEAIVAPR